MDVVDLTRELVAIDSQNPGALEPKIAGFVSAWARERGFDVTVLEPVSGRPNLLVGADLGGRGHLAFSGHLDTKPVGDALAQWHTDPLELTIDGDDAYGLGATDMKGAVAAMLLALERLTQADHPLGRISLLLTADEEQGSDAGAMALVADGSLQGIDAVVIGEPSGIIAPWEAIHLVSRGICCFWVDLHTQQGHSGLSPTLGRNAIQVAADVLHAFETFRPQVAAPGEVRCEPTVNPGPFISGGVSFGTWPGHCRVGMEIRLVPGMDRAGLDHQIRELLDHTVAAPARWELEYVSTAQGWMPAVELAPGAQVARAAAAAARQVLGRELPFAAFPGGTDATYLMGQAGIPTIASFGPGWISVAHGANERVGVSQLHEAVDLYERTAVEYFGAD